MDIEKSKEIKARAELDSQLTSQLNKLLPTVLSKTGFSSIHSLNAKIGGKHRHYLDIRNAVVYSPDHFASLWLDGFKTIVDEHKANSQFTRSEYLTYQLLKAHKEFQEYLFLFLKRTYIRYADSLSKKKPPIEDSEVWIGQNNANYGLLITPRFVNGSWENDASEIRHFEPKYWSIGHVIKTGLCVPNSPNKIVFNDIEQYLTFFLNVIVRNSGSTYEYQIAQKYCDYVRSSDNPENLALIIPEFRYEGIDVQHKYRLDFSIIESSELNKIGFELSPWSTHGYISKTKQMTQKEINDAAQDNFNKEMKKHKDFFKKHGIFTLIYTDNDLKNLDGIFDDMKRYIEPKTVGKQMKFHIFNEFFD
ncbi:hypothetical protein [Ekhidna sp.]|uniref:hypothetical protein n=1 Tax=Ekhidna sp. TaxID=2608089 RepID=UPI003B5A5978